MATWRVTYTLVDDQSPKAGVRQKTFTGDFADYATASAAESDLRTDLLAATSAGVARVQLTEDTVLTPSAASGSNVFEVASVTIPINAVKNANYQLPAPVAALQAANNAVDTTATEWTDLMDNYTATAGWEVSDTEHIDTTISYGNGKLIYVRSGQRFS